MTTETLPVPRVNSMHRPVSLAVVGAGARGAAYAEIAVGLGGRARVNAVAEIDPYRREQFARCHHLLADRVFADWHELADRPRLADAAIIALQDAQHLQAALALIDKGYDILLEKPIATTWADCERIVAAAQSAGVRAAVCHVMRYSPYTLALKRELCTGVIGDIVSVEHLEPVGYYHFAHSYVRGNWRNEKESSFVLLTKACHDIDWLGHIVDAPARRVSSFGSLVHFTPANRPTGAADRCLDCSVESDCPFSAVRIYRSGLRDGGTKAYFTRTMAPEMTEDAVSQALANGPYGRCVYACDNDVADHQVVSIEYAGGVTASFTLAAFTPLENRRTRIFGTRGQITSDGRYIHVYDFHSERTTTIDTSVDGASAAQGHAGGDAGLITAFVDAMYTGHPELIATDLAESLESHRVVFAAERARRTGCVVNLS